MGKISKKTLNKVLWRTQTCQFSHNYERMQSLSLTYCMAPVLEELYKDAPKEDRVNAMHRYLEYFNTHPIAIPFILGIATAMEEATDEDNKDAVTGIKTGLMGPFAGLGDSMLNLTWFPIAGSIGASLSVANGSLLGPIVMFLLINVLYWPLKYFGLHWGYEKGAEILNGENGGMQVFERLGNFANVLGCTVVGGLIANTVKLNTALEFVGAPVEQVQADGTVKMVENVIKVQEKLDAIMPCLLPVVLTALCYLFLKKSNGKHVAAFILMLLVVCTALSYFKILA